MDSYRTPSRSPLPRLIAFSIVSSGTLAARAFWYAVRSVALASRSPPPSRAATSMARMHFAKTLARALSWAPLRYLVVAHLEWPDIALPRSSSADGLGARPRLTDSGPLQFRSRD